MKSWLLFFLGTLAYFLIRFNNRKDKKAFDLKFWLQDNWPELATTFILDLIAMIILMDEGTNLTGWLATKLPEGFVLPGKLLVSAFCGLGFGYLAYEFVQRVVKRKVKSIKE